MFGGLREILQLHLKLRERRIQEIITGERLAFAARLNRFDSFRWSLHVGDGNGAIQLDDGRYVVLNREYKPIGFRTREHVDYQAYPIAVRFKGLTKATARKLSYKGSEDLERIALYNDGCIPTKSAANMEAYLARLALLAELEIEEDAPAS